MIQDFIFAVGSLMFLVVMAPSILSTSTRVPRGTSVPMAVVCLIFSATFVSLGMWMAATTDALQAVAWSYIVARRHP